MPLFTWFDTYSIRNRELDDQHRELFSIINRLYDSSYESENAPLVHAILDELNSYADHHFTAEEEYMERIGYEGLAKQKLEHDSFRKKIARLKLSNDMNDAELTKETIVFLGKWLLHHVTEEDRKISC